MTHMVLLSLHDLIKQELLLPIVPQLLPPQLQGSCSLLWQHSCLCSLQNTPIRAKEGSQVQHAMPGVRAYMADGLMMVGHANLA